MGLLCSGKLDIRRACGSVEQKATEEWKYKIRTEPLLPDSARLRTRACDSTMLGGARTMACGGAECRRQCAPTVSIPGRSSRAAEGITDSGPTAPSLAACCEKQSVMTARLAAAE
jgi:hypothetical protein